MASRSIIPRPPTPRCARPCAARIRTGNWPKQGAATPISGTTSAPPPRSFTVIPPRTTARLFGNAAGAQEDRNSPRFASRPPSTSLNARGAGLSIPRAVWPADVARPERNDWRCSQANIKLGLDNVRKWREPPLHLLFPDWREDNPLFRVGANNTFHLPD